MTDEQILSIFIDELKITENAIFVREKEIIELQGKIKYLKEVKSAIFCAAKKINPEFSKTNEH